MKEEECMTLELFKKDTCPYCRRVMQYIASAGRTDIAYRDIIENEEDARELLAIGGKKQVPCLFINGKPLYESLDIIQWLKDHPQE
jgi:glutaredoxin